MPGHPDELSPRARGPRVLAAAVLAAASAGAFALVALGRTIAARLRFPLDLEWMEGGTLVHALRLARGQGIYVEPSVDFIPFLYTPLYPALLALLSRLAPLGYALGRAVSVLALSGALALLVALAATEGRGQGRAGRLAALALGVGGAGLVCAAYSFTGSFFDLVRGDSLALCLQALALGAAYRGGTWRSAALAGALIALGFFTKQTSSILGVAIGVGLLLASWRRGLVYGAGAAALLGAGLGLLQRTSDGWFWTYVFELHQSHAFNRDLAFVRAPLAIAGHTWPSWAALASSIVLLARRRGLRRADAILIASAVAGVASAVIGFGTQWAFDNAFIPAVYFPALAAAVLGARAAGSLACEVRPGRAWHHPLAAVAALLLGAQVVLAGMPPVRHRPGPADHAAAARFLEHLRALPGDGFIPFHPFYAVLAGKRPFVHRMGVWDVAAKLGRPRGLDEALAGQRFPWIVLDWKSRPGEWRAMEGRYHLVHTFTDGVDAVRMFSGAETSPRWLYRPTPPVRALAPGARAIARFDDGTWGDVAVEGEAFGAAPAPTGDFGHGAGVADSGRAGPSARGRLRSPPFVIDRARLSFLVAGDAAPGLRVALLVDGELRRSFAPGGRAELVEWDVTDLRGRTGVLVVEDASPEGALRVDELALHDP